MSGGKSPRSGDNLATLLKGDRYGGVNVEQWLAQYPPIDERKEYKIPAHLRDQGIGTSKQVDHESKEEEQGNEGQGIRQDQQGVEG